MREVKQEEIMRDHGDMIRVMETAILRNVELRICKNIMMNRRGQAKKGAGRMPWHQEPMKDVTSCEKLRGAANKLRSADIRMGKPA